jgi:hypothetical protein
MSQYDYIKTLGEEEFRRLTGVKRREMDPKGQTKEIAK